jgi:hypothetical protein
MDENEGDALLAATRELVVVKFAPSGRRAWASWICDVGIEDVLAAFVDVRGDLPGVEEHLHSSFSKSPGFWSCTFLQLPSF